MGRIPNYIRTITNKYKGNVTEKIALHYLKKSGFVCQRFFNVNHELKKDPQELVDHLERFKKSQKKFEFDSPPLGFRIVSPVEKTWDEYRREQLEYTKWHIENVEKTIKGRKELKSELSKKWGLHLNDLAKYCKWLDEQKAYPRYPDFIAKKDEEVFVVEVKSKSEKGVAFFSESQRKALLKAYDFGLVPVLLIIPIDINIEIGGVKFRMGKDFWENES